MLLLPSELQEQASHKAAESIALASIHFGQAIPVPAVRFDLRGRVAGYAVYRNWSIRINNDLLVKYSDRIINITVPHEIAHLVAHCVYGKGIQPHGCEWQRIMRDVFGLEPRRTHNMQTTPARRVQKYKLYCGCDSGHVATKVIVNRMRQGYTYTCKRCNQHLSFTPVEKPSFDDLLDSIK